MNNRPIHENLDTSFVNLPALVRYLLSRQFAGNIRVELSGYEADIALTAAGEMRVREYDRIAGRISEGEEALQRLLIRAREPGGMINVYEAVEDSSAPIEELTEILEHLPIAVAEKQTVVSLAAKAPHSNGNSKHAPVESSPFENDLKPPPSPPSFPFELSNKYEAKAKEQNLSAHDWQMLLNLTGELLNTIDDSLAGANLEFAAAFEKARSEISKDYPFLDPSAHIFDYKNGKIIVSEQINAKLFAASINEALRRILDKLGRNPKFLNIYFITTQKVIELIEKRQPLYDKFFITPQLERTVGA